MEEKRRYIRINTPVLVEFPHPETMKTERSFTSDVSGTGLKFPTTVRLPIGQDVPLTLQLPFLSQPMHATGRVMWVRETSRLGAPQYEIGMKFQWVDDPDRQRLMSHLSAFFPGRK